MTNRQVNSPYTESAKRQSKMMRDVIVEEQRKTGALNDGERYAEQAIDRYKRIVKGESNDA